MRQFASSVLVICPLHGLVLGFFFVWFLFGCWVFFKVDSQIDTLQTHQSSYEEEGEISNFQVFMSDFFTPNNEFYVRPLEKPSVV